MRIYIIRILYYTTFFYIRGWGQRKDGPTKADTLLRFAEPEVVLVGPSLLQLSILETFRYNKEYELIFGREVVFW